MENEEVTNQANQVDQSDLGSDGHQFSELIPAYLEYVRVEHGRVPVTVERYRARLERFITEMGDWINGPGAGDPARPGATTE